MNKQISRHRARDESLQGSNIKCEPNIVDDLNLNLCKTETK